MSTESTVLLLSTADTDLLAARASGAPYRIGNPTRVDVTEELPALLDGAAVAVVRLLGGRRAWEDGLAALKASGVPTVLLGGESVPDAELMAESTVHAGSVAEALRYLVEGGPDNLVELARFLTEDVLPAGRGRSGDAQSRHSAEPQKMPEWGVHGSRAHQEGRPTVGVLFYRAHELSGNTAFIDTLCDRIEERGANALPVYCGSLRGADPELYELLGRADTLIATVLAAGGTRASDASAGGDDEAWDIGALADLDVPVLQGLCLTSSRAAWLESDAALSPMDAAMQVAIPEFDGRIITVPFSFKEQGPDDVPVYVADPERAARVAGIAVRHARLRHKPNAEKKLAIVFTAYPTKHSRVGNAVGLDTPASAVRVLDALRDAGYAVDGHPDNGDELIHRLINAGGHDVEWLTEEQLAAAPARVPLADYRAWFDKLEPGLRDGMLQHWGEPPGSLYVDGDEIVLASLQFGNVVVMIQPPRGFGENPIAIYHDPDMPPSHHYMAAYRWLEESFGADAVVHMGKHGTMEWLPGKGLGLSAGCGPDAVLGELPLVYPFIVNDPGEGTQAKRRGHATVVDHLVPPMARADTYGDLAKLEQLLDEYALVSDLDPTKAPAVRAQIWTLVKAAELHHDLHVDEQPDDGDFDEFVMHIDGYLCEIKDVQIRDGLHILGGGPTGEPRVNLVLAVLRASQVWGGTAGALPGLRAALAEHFGLVEKELLGEPGAAVKVPVELTELVDGPARTGADAIDLLEQLCRRLAEGMEERGWQLTAVVPLVREVLRTELADAVAVLGFACEEVVPRLARTTDEIDHILRALNGGYVPAGPSGSPTRGLVNVLPTGRNFYSVDPKAIPSRLSWEVGQSLADSLVARYLADTGAYPKSVGLTVWGTSAMRTQGDDIAEILALLGCRPVWDDASRRVTGFEVVPADELGRPRIDVTVRISGFFRDAFPHVVGLLDDAVRTVAELDEPADANYVRAHADEDTAEHGDRRRATARIFGSKPGAYGAGLLPLIDARNWSSDADLAEVYAVWGGYAYGRGLDGRAARGDMETAFRRIAIAAKNVDTREHDLVDADDYFQYHGGMVAMVRHLTGESPEAYVGDSATPDQVKTRTLGEETHRVFRARVVNPRWMAAMRRHGYKGAFEMAATVDYLFGYDATAGVVDDWMYEKLSAEYVFDPENREFMQKSNPWALRGITERLLEAADRGLWAEPDAQTLEQLRATYLQLEGDLEETMSTPYPFTAIVGQDDLRLALLLNAVSSRVGGVLVRGEKGTAKSTAVRALSALIPEVAVVSGCRFSCDPASPDPACPDGPHESGGAGARPARMVELPVGASEDRLVGALDIERALAEGVKAFQPGLLADAHRGILYVDEVNLLHDHLVDLLLDAAAMGASYVEREGVSVRHAARFLLVGTMNPEEGELRPQLLDRFGLTVEVAASREPDQRVEVVRRRLAYDDDPEGFAARWADEESALRARIVAARALLPEVRLGEGSLRQIAATCAAFEVDGMRADIVMARTATALAAWAGRTDVIAEDVRQAALLALPHRRRRNPFDAPGLDEDKLDDTLEEFGDESEPDDDPDPDGPGGGGQPPQTGPDDPSPVDAPSEGETPAREQEAEGGQPRPAGPGEQQPVRAAEPFRTKALSVPGIGEGAAGRRSRARTEHGRTTGARRPRGALTKLHLAATVQAAAPHQRARGRSGRGLVVRRDDLRQASREGREGNLVLFVVDASGSMAARQRMSAVKGAVLSLLLDAYQRRDKVGLVTFRGKDAEVALPPTSSVEAAAARLDLLPTGGRTPLSAGLLKAHNVLRVERMRDPSRRPLLVVVTDGRATGGVDPVALAARAARLHAAEGTAAIVVDCESGPVRLGLAGSLAGDLGGTVITLDELRADAIAGLVKDVQGARRAA